MDHRPSSAPALHVAVLESNVELLQDILLPALKNCGFRGAGATSAAELYRIMLAQRFDIVLLDVCPPDEYGFTVAQHLRAMSNIGIVMLTGRDRRQHPIQALESGADLYLTKPVDLDLLAAMLHSLKRRLTCQLSNKTVANSPSRPEWRLENGGWRLVSPRGNVVTLTAAEQCIVMTLAIKNGQLVRREALIEAIARNAYDFDPHRLEMTIHRLRRKVLASTGEALPLQTVRGKGYLLSCDASRSMSSLPR
ncbi:response regulator transcription factor [Dyella caseinilytica]|uniref:Response regulator transcription factor n=1 Tax=Dyella caseinilytica TaxID=1849581 RepID=A0ABX7GXN7_9GAMM|nr:response regulator transcription factor [Dyella caseinilytica]QRN54447.1 response regulator transcription factor [Dyella caseinilytica]